MTSVLLVDDDRELTEMLSQYLTRESFDVTCTNSAEEGEIEALSGRHDIVVLDIMMPRISGIEVLRRIRAKSQLPVIRLTPRGDTI
ncbi:response regulator, partial [Pseudomonas syringae]|uniref:response regulator n=1 Tax=Pseudomonas syringae TaxID=317 RepID=UPI001F48C7FC